MPRPNRQFVRAILISLMLIVGSVQAQVSYYCSMMNAVVLDDCCCADGDLDDMMAADSHEPCCEKSVELSLDSVTDQAQPQAKPIKFESDVDPPDILLSTTQIQLPDLGTTTLSRANQAGIYDPVGSATYLITQRLRI